VNCSRLCLSHRAMTQLRLRLNELFSPKKNLDSRLEMWFSIINMWQTRTPILWLRAKSLVRHQHCAKLQLASFERHLIKKIITCTLTRQNANAPWCELAVTQFHKERLHKKLRKREGALLHRTSLQLGMRTPTIVHYAPDRALISCAVAPDLQLGIEVEAYS
jgi:hypothetical protein